MADVASVEPAIGAFDSAPPSRLREFWRAFAQNRGAVIGLVLVGLLLVLALGADVIAPHSPNEQFREFTLTPPAWDAAGSSRFLLGTDPVGRDILSRLIHGTRLSLLIGTISVAISLTIGAILGLCAGYFRGIVDTSIMLQAKPGAFARLGQGGADRGSFLHSSRYDFNDSVIPLGAGFLAALAERAMPIVR